MAILVVDDDLLQRRVLEVLLTKAGRTVLLARDAEEAWDVLQRGGVRFLVTDWVMPGMSGPQLIHRVRNADLEGYVYALLLTSQDEQRDVVAGLEAGADDYLTKPFDRDELLARIAIGERILALEARLRQIATEDELTGLLNRRAGWSRIEQELSRAKRERTPLSVLLMDIDHFKRINDEYGHPVGDEALRLLGDVLRRSRRDYDHVARWGGEEFLLVLPSATAEEAAGAAERIRASVEEAWLPRADGGEVRFTLSVGVAEATADSTLEDLVRRADEALYRAKREGRNRVCVSPCPAIPA